MSFTSRAWRILSVIAMLAAVFGVGSSGPTASARPAATPALAETNVKAVQRKAPPLSSAAINRKTRFRASDANDTGCPQNTALPTDQQQAAADDVRVNQDRSCFPQNETSIAVNPRNALNVVGGANDYRLGFGTSGFYSSKDGGRTWADGIIPFPSLPNGDNLDGGGDPAIAFDRAGVAYYAEINFNRTDETNGVFVSRSTNGGSTWTRACVPVDNSGNPNDDQAVCGGFGDVRQPGDGVVSFQADPDPVDADDPANTPADIVFDDKEYIAAGPRPAGVAPQCFGPETDRVVACRAGAVGPDRLYVTWTRFEQGVVQTTQGPVVVLRNANIFFSFSDDQARSWSRPKAISGSAAFCLRFFETGNTCNFNQFSVPTVNPATGALYVAFENFNTPDEDQYLVVRSANGGGTFTAPFFAAPVFDVNYPVSGNPDPTDPRQGQRTRPDCRTRGQQDGRPVLTNSCFRVISGGNIVVDKRGGAFADDLYLVLSDNRNGTRLSSNTDVFMYKSTNGGNTWIGPTRVNNDRSRRPTTVPRDCQATDPGCAGDFGNDQWFPWVDIGTAGQLNVVYEDRRLDTDSVRHEYPNGSAVDSRQRPGNYFVWFFGSQCTATTAARSCVAPEAQERTGRPAGPVNPGPGQVQGNRQTAFPFFNHSISDVASNWDYTFRAGIFAGDYSGVAVRGTRVYPLWTDARNGRSSRNQPGRNPICEQSDVYTDVYPATGARNDSSSAVRTAGYLTARCP